MTAAPVARVSVSRGGWVLLAGLVALASAGWLPPVAAAMHGVPTWGLAAATIFPLAAHEAAHLGAGALAGVKPLGLEITGRGLGAVLADDPDDHPRRPRRARQQVVISLGGAFSAFPSALLVAALTTDPACLTMGLTACVGSCLQLWPRAGSDGDRALRAYRQLAAVPAARRARLQNA